MRRARVLMPALVMVIALALPAPAASAAEALPSPRPEQAPAEHYRIGPEDALHITVWKNDAMSRTVPVRPDGMVTVPPQRHGGMG